MRGDNGPTDNSALKTGKSIICSSNLPASAPMLQVRYIKLLLITNGTGTSMPLQQADIIKL